jgi:hypothetical protein
VPQEAQESRNKNVAGEASLLADRRPFQTNKRAAHCEAAFLFLPPPTKLPAARVPPNPTASERLRYAARSAGRPFSSVWRSADLRASTWAR